MRWFRFYTEFRSDPKVRTMPEALQLRLVILFCLASEGGLEDLTDDMVGHAMGLSPGELDRTRKAFEARSFIESGSWTPRNWGKRQRESDSSTERTRNYRERKNQSPKGDTKTTSQHVTDCDRHSDGNVTASRALLRASEQNRTETDQNRTDTECARVTDFDTDNIRHLVEYVDQVTGGSWGSHAFQWVRSNMHTVAVWRAAWGIVAQMDRLPSRPWNYAAKIIESWPGGIPPATPTTQPRGQVKPPPPIPEEEEAEKARLEVMERQILAQLGRTA
jgi:hypothetical protein